MAGVYGVGIAGDVVCALIAALHVRIFMLEAILWHRVASKVFGMPKAVVHVSGTLAANQGAYNLILAAGLIWSLAEQDVNAKNFFLSAVLVAGTFGGGSVGFKLLLIQSVPAFIGLILINFGYKDVNDWTFRHPLITLVIEIAAGLVSYAMGAWVKRREEALVQADKVSEQIERNTQTVSQNRNSPVGAGYGTTR